MSAPKKDPVSLSAPEKKTRRRLTPEERIAAREAEIAQIKARQIESRKDALDYVVLFLSGLRDKADTFRDFALASRCRDALTVLTRENVGQAASTSEELHS